MSNSSPKRVHSFLAHSGGTTSASFSPNGNILATGGYDCVIRIWDVQSWQEQRVLPGHRRGYVTFSPDGTLLISGGLYRDADVYNTASWQIQETLEGASGVWGLAYAPEGKQIAIFQSNPIPSGDTRGTVEIWDTERWRVAFALDVAAAHFYALSYSPDGERAAVAAYPNGLVSIWSRDLTHKITEFPAHESFTWGLAFSPVGGILATGGADNLARLWDTATWQMQHELIHEEMAADVKYSNAVLCVTFSPDGKWLATGGLDGAITIWQLDRMA